MERKLSKTYPSYVPPEIAMMEDLLPSYTSLVKDGQLQAPFRLDPSKMQEAAAAQRAYALRDQPSAYTQTLMGKDEMDRQNAMEQMNRQAMPMAGNPLLAGMRGIQAKLAGQQQLAGQAQGGIYDRLAADRANQIQQMKAQVGAENVAMSPEQFNIQNTLAQRQADFAAQQQSWAEKMKAYGAGQTAAGIRSSGKK